MPDLRKLRQTRDVTNIPAARRPIKRRDYAISQAGFGRDMDPAFSTLAQQDLESRAMPADQMPGPSTILERVVYKALHGLGYRPPDLDFQSSMLGARFSYQFGRQVADFVIHSLGIVIEVQGEYWHEDADQKNRDAERELQLRAVPRRPPWRVFYLEERVVRSRYELEAWLLDHVVFAGLRSEWRSSSAAAIHSQNPFYPLPDMGDATIPDTGGGGGGGTAPVTYDFTAINPVNHLINGGFDHSSYTGWTADSDVTVSVANGKLVLNASVANKGVYQTVTNLEPGGTYYLACKVDAGGNSARFYTTGGLANPDRTVALTLSATDGALCVASAAGDITVHLVATTTGVDITFDNVILVRGNQLWGWGVAPHADTLDGLHADAAGTADAHVVATNADGDAVVTRLGIGAAPDYPLHVIGAGRIDGDLTFVGAQSILTTADSLTLAPAADLDLTPGGTARVRATSGVRLQSDNYVSQMTGWGIGYNGGADFRYLYADELHAKSFIADLEQALAGGQIIAKSVAVVAVDFTVPAAGSAGTLTVEDLPGASGQAVFQAGDIVRLRQFSRGSGSLTIADCWGVVTGYSDNGDGTQDWTFTRSSGAAGGTAAGTIAAKTLALDYGVSGNGFYEVNAIDGAWAQNSPYAQVVTWTTHPQSGQVVRSRWGNLKGIFNAANEYGLYAGDGVADASKFLRISSQTVEAHNLPIKMYDGASATIALDPAAPSLALGNPIPTGWLSQSGYWAGRHTDGTYRAYLGTVSGGTLAQGWQWDGSALTVRGAIVVQPGSSGISNLSDAGALATKNSVDLATDDVTNKTLDYVADGATYKRTTANEKAGGARGYAGLDTSGNVARVIRGAAIAAGSAATGLNLTADYLGYYDGTAFRTYLDKNGNFLFSKPGGASLLWSASAGKLQGRDASSNVQWETDATTGAITAGGGRVTLDTAGAHLIGNSSTDTTQAALQFRDGEASSARYARLWGWGASGDGYHLKMGFDNDAGWGVYPYIDMRVGLGIQTVSIYTGASSYASFSSSALSLTGLNLNVSGGLNLGTATGAGTGRINANNGADSLLEWNLQAGSKATQFVRLNFYDRATGKWSLGKDDQNRFYIREFGVADRFHIVAGGRFLLGTTTDVGARLHVSGDVFVTAQTIPSSGAGVNLTYASSVGYVQAYDYGSSAWRNIKVRGDHTILLSDNTSAPADSELDAKDICFYIDTSGNLKAKWKNAAGTSKTVTLYSW